MDVQDIVEEHLKANGYDGLWIEEQGGEDGKEEGSEEASG